MYLREIKRYDIAPPDLFTLTEADMARLVQEKAEQWSRPLMTWDRLIKNMGRCRGLQAPEAERLCSLNAVIAGKKDKEDSAILPAASAKPWAVRVHPQWLATVPYEPHWFVTSPPTVPSQGVNTCALDVCLVLGRLMHVGVSVADQLPSEELIGLQAERPLTYWMWLTVARPWQTISQKSLDGTRNALLEMIRAQLPGLTVNERKDGELALDTLLEVLLHGSRSASWTQKPGHRCVNCLKKTFGSVGAQRVNQIGYFPDSRHGSTRGWSGWVNRAFIGQGDVGGLRCKRKGCAATNAQLVPLNMVLDRMPPYLVVSHGFENVGEEQSRMMFDNITVTYATPWKDGLEATYRWAGLIERIQGNHFVLHWKCDKGRVWTFNGMKARATRVSPTSMERLSPPDVAKGKSQKGADLASRVGAVIYQLQ